ncbi:hypothetical protein [Sphingobacterium paucimobilis]|uniref:Lipoprotein n=1 Tax=Sphingobacterium paucimobilis HER1398 TaxID=1346330 RepID=U2HFV1_9SPHI|nr:hypothetical protein [Sphingobacterium paucimobilis]ERJ60631.1 hypothetical protein M472_17890 [Sphingobacterium paucimobilis HER1398]
MKPLISILLLIFSISLVSCEKEDENVLEQELEQDNLHSRDSISFILDDKRYSSIKLDGFGFANKQTNIKPYSNVLKNREAAYITGGYWWYGEKDSLLFEHTFSFEAPELSNISFATSQKFAIEDLTQTSNLLIPMIDDTTFHVGAKPFAIDRDLENTTYGVSIEVSPLQPVKRLSTSLPGSSIILRSKIDKDLQDDSYFQIISIDSLQDNALRIEARFEANIYDDRGTAYRLKDGFVRFKTKLNYLK